MRKFALLLLLAAIPAFGQSFVNIAPENCVWHAGDDADGALHWAAPDLDESGWKPFTLWKLNPNEPRIWVRCHVDLSPLRATRQPALQLDLPGAYELFVDGSPAGAFGNMRTGDFTADFVRTFPLRVPLGTNAKSTVALRILFRLNFGRGFGLTSGKTGAEWMAGDQERLDDRRNSLAFVNGARLLPTTIAFFVVSIAGVMMLGLYLSDRSKPAFLYFAIVCLALGFRRIEEQLIVSLYPLPLFEYRLLEAALVGALVFYVPLVYALARKPVARFYRGVIVLSLILPIMNIIVAITSAAQSLQLRPLMDWTSIVVNILFAVAFLSPFVAFRPWRQITNSMRAVAIVVMVWGAANEFYIASLLSFNFSLSSITPFTLPWFPVVQETRATLMIAAIVVLLVLLFRDQRKTAEERAQLTGEMEAAREVQQQLVPASIPRVAGFDIAAAYLPAAEVGGDFYQVLPLADGATLIAVGDVSGKGLKAAMTGALAIGALRTLAAEGLGPGALLTRLNRQMADARSGGFITCLCLHVAANGAISFANAGHIPPYFEGREIGSESSLPLGLNACAEYAETKITLAPGDRLTLITDGVIEATDPSTRELFGFKRTAVLSTQTAAAIAQSAQHFGQEDDITVLTLSLLPADAALASTIRCTAD